MSQQLSFFEVSPAPAVAPVAVAAAPARQPKAARYHIEQEGEYYHVWHGETYLGGIYHLGGKVWNLYFPGEHGVCGFGGPGQQGAAAELHQCSIRKAKGLEV